MKKVITTIVLILSLVSVLYTGLILGFIARVRPTQSNTLIPIKKITGIDERATLKTMSTPLTGTQIPARDTDPWCHCGILLTSSEANTCVKDIRIIDVYGSNCTIVYSTTKESGLFETQDFPLSNLNYNISKVSKADDGFKTKLHGSHFTLLDSDVNNSATAIYIALFIASLSVFIFCVCSLLKKTVNNY